MWEGVTRRRLKKASRRLSCSCRASLRAARWTASRLRRASRPTYPASSPSRRYARRRRCPSPERAARRRRAAPRPSLLRRRRRRRGARRGEPRAEPAAAEPGRVFLARLQVRVEPREARGQPPRRLRRPRRARILRRPSPLLPAVSSGALRLGPLRLARLALGGVQRVLLEQVVERVVVDLGGDLLAAQHRVRRLRGGVRGNGVRVLLPLLLRAARALVAGAGARVVVAVAASLAACVSR